MDWYKQITTNLHKPTDKQVYKLRKLIAIRNNTLK